MHVRYLCLLVAIDIVALPFGDFQHNVRVVP